MQNISHPSGRPDRQNQGSTLKCEGMSSSSKNPSQVHWQLRGVYFDNAGNKTERTSWQVFFTMDFQHYIWTSCDDKFRPHY